MILVVGSTGMLGQEICRLLSEQNLPFRALVRRDSDPRKVEQLRAWGAEISVGDVKEFSSLLVACRDVDQIISTASATYSRREGDSIETVDHKGQLNLIEAADEAGVDHFVLVSFRKIRAHPNPLCQAKRAVESALKRSDMSWCSLQANFFMEVWLSPAVGFNPLERKVSIYGSGENKLSWISYRDVARFAVAALDQPLGFNNVIEIGGPEALSPNEVLRIFERVLGQSFQVTYIPTEALAQQKAAANNSLEASFAALMLNYADGNVMDMDQVLLRIPLQLTTVEEYARSMISEPVS